MVEWSFDTRDAQAARRTRLAFVAYVRRRCGEVDASSAELILGELIGNVARYAPGEAHIAVDVQDAWVTIHVRDHGPGFRPGAHPHAEPLAEHGRGLLIVETLSDDFDVRCEPADGCRVRARIPVHAR
ncbi:MAG: ATP-binding protein [Candidatus Velthaea sp.]